MRERWVSVHSTPRVFVALPDAQLLGEDKAARVGYDSGWPQGRVVAFTSVTIVLQRRRGC